MIKILLSVMLLTSYAFAQDLSKNSIEVVVSTNPLADVVKQIGAGHFNVSILLEDITNPHVFEIKPEQSKKLEESDLIVFNGAGLENWAQNLELKSKLFFMSQALGIAGFANANSETNSHIWLDPKRMIKQVQYFSKEMCRRYFAWCEQIRTNSEVYISELNKLDLEIKNEVASWKQNKFISFHPAWTYFAESYNLKEIAVIKHSESHSITISEYSELLKIIKKEQVKVLFIEKGQSVDQISSLVQDTQLKVANLDPMGQLHEPYLNIMRRIVSTMSTVMKE